MELDKKKYSAAFIKSFKIGVEETEKLRKMLEGKVLSDSVQAMCDYFTKYNIQPPRAQRIIKEFDLPDEFFQEIYNHLWNSGSIRLSGQMYVKVRDNPNSHSYQMDGTVYKVFGPAGCITYVAEDCTGWRGNNLPGYKNSLIAATDEEILDYMEKQRKFKKETKERKLKEERECLEKIAKKKKGPLTQYFTIDSTTITTDTWR